MYVGFDTKTYGKLLLGLVLSVVHFLRGDNFARNKLWASRLACYN